MKKDDDYYRALDLRSLAASIPRDKEGREQSEEFQDMLIAIVLRCKTEPIRATDLRTYLGEPDLVKRTKGAEIWQYSWRGEHCSGEYRSATPFIVKQGRVLGVRRKSLAPASSK